MSHALHSKSGLKGTFSHISFYRHFLLFLLGCLLIAPSFGAIFTVNNTGIGSLRNRITASNTTPGTDTIQFAVSGTITLVSALPAISDRVFIDGSSAPGYTNCGVPLVALNGASAGAANGIQLLFGASGSTIKALNIRSFQLNGIQMIDSDANTIQSCYICTTQNGLIGFPNGLNGIQLENGSDFNTIGGLVACDGNLVSGNGGSGISLNNSSSNTIIGNIVGLNRLGSAFIPNTSIGVIMVNGSNDNQLGGNTLEQRNLISGNGSGLTGNGVDINGCSGSIIQNNYIGLDVTGTVAIGNAENGISLNAAPNTQVGGPGPLEGNYIADHNFHAMVLNGGSNSTVIQGNIVGTNAAGTVAFGNDDSGVIVINSNDVEIGGPGAGEGNLLSGSISEFGVFIISSNNTIVQGNLIGTDITGTQPLPNFGGGVQLVANSDLSIIGGTSPGEANIIAFDSGFGVGILNADCTQNLVSGNSMFCNIGKGIDLNSAGNNLHPSPVILTLTTSGATGTAFANDIVELFYDSLCTANCQGKDFIASVTANATGNWSYTGPLNSNATVVAIGIRTNPPSANNTSEAICQVILPVEWASFEATPVAANAVELDWATTAEANASHFEVEHSTTGADFEIIGQVTAANVAQGSRYQFTDPHAGPGMHFYRLRQVDFNGEFSWSETRQVWLDPAESPFEFGANPADEQIRFRVNPEAADRYSFLLFDPAGKALFQESGAAVMGDWVELPASQLAAGLYYLRIQAGAQQVTRKVVIRH